MVVKLPIDSFDWLRWRCGNPVEIFGKSIRQDSLPISKIREYAVGYCNAESLLCRPKNGHKAVMFCVDEKYSWFHLRNEEFKICFPEV